MASDGVWEVLSEAELLESIRPESDPQQAAQALVELAVLRESQFMHGSDASAAVIRIDTVPLTSGAA